VPSLVVIVAIGVPFYSLGPRGPATSILTLPDYSYPGLIGGSGSHCT
jgi:hypothetical protein